MSPLRGADLKGILEPDELSKNTEKFSLYCCDVRGRIFFRIFILVVLLSLNFYFFKNVLEITLVGFKFSKSRYVFEGSCVNKDTVKFRK